MNYLKIYVKLIRNAQKRYLKETIFTEKHHIFPVSIFGNNSKTCCLTYREHFVSHRLLFYIFLKRYKSTDIRTQKMAMAIHRMVYGKNGVINNSRMFDVAKKAVIYAKLGRPREDCIGKRYFGACEEKIREGIEKMRKKKTGMKVKYPKNRKSPPCSIEKKQKIAEARLKTKNKFINMTKEEFELWIKQQNLYGPSGRKNTNVIRVLIWRGIDQNEYYTN